MIALVYILKILIVIGIVTMIHEFGHFLFAKLFKMPVNELAVGFGPKILSKKLGETEYSLRALPLGGYTSIVGEAEELDDPAAFCNKPAWQRIIVVLAGAFFNAVLAFIILYVISTTGSYIYNNKISDVNDNSIAMQNGIQVGDKITKVDGKKINWYIDIDETKIANDHMTIELERNGQKIIKEINNPKEKWGYLGVNLKQVDGQTTNIVDIVLPGQTAQYSDIRPGDQIIKVNGIDTPTNTLLVGEVAKYPDQEIVLTINRNDTIIEKTVIPKYRYIFDLGIMPELVNNASIFERLSYGMDQTIKSMGTIFDSYVQLLTGRVSFDELSGIIGVAEVVGKSNGFLEFMQLLAFISFSIGIANLLPFPPLDGGKIVLILIEKISRKKVPEKVEAILSFVGMALLIGLSIYIGYKDITRIF